MPSTLQKLVVLHTNDIHSCFERMARVSSTIRSLRRHYAPHETLVLEIGDHMDRLTPETEGTEGLINVEVMNATGYDLLVPGNREGLIFKPEVLDGLFGKHAGFKVVCSHLKDAKTAALPFWLEPYRIVEKNGLRIGVLGVTAFLKPFYEALGWDIRDPYAAVAEWVKTLRPQVDVILLMSHLGLKYDMRMAEEIEGIDVIFGGHTHHLLEEPMLVGRTYLCGAGDMGRYVGVLELDYDPRTRSVARVDGKCVSVADYPEDEDIVEIISRFREEAAQRLQQPITILSESLALSGSGESQLGNLLASALRRQAEAEIGLVNAGQFIGDLAAGPVSKHDLMAACPSPAKPCRMLLSGENLRAALEESLLSEFNGQKINKFNFRGISLGSLCLDGVEVEYDSALPPHSRIIRILVNGEPLEDNRKYVVGTIDMFTYGFGYLSLAKGSEVRFYLPAFIRDLMEEHLKSPLELLKCKDLHWHDLNRNFD